MKLSEHVALIKNRITSAYDKHLARLGLGAARVMEIDKLPTALQDKRRRIDQLVDNHKEEMGTYGEARARALEELTFTLFNRLAAIKVMEAHTLFPEIVTQRPEHGDRSFGHKAWLEEHPDMRDVELEGLRSYLAHEFDRLGAEIPLYHRDYPYALLPFVLDLKEVIDAVNAVVEDSQIENDIWQSDDILGWLYESYNNEKKKAHKDSKSKTEYDKVSLQSQVYTPRWVVKFLVDNSLGKLYLEMFPDSAIKEKYAIANAPNQRIREPKPLLEIRLIDPACGSGNFELYAFDLFYDLYLDQIENYDARYRKQDIPQLIIEHNLHGIDLDDRAVQLAHLGLYIKAKRKNRNIGQLKFQVVSSAFFLPAYEEVQHIFEPVERPLSEEQKDLVQEIWGDLQRAYRFGSLVRIGEKVNTRLESLITRFRRPQMDLFAEKDIVDFEIFRENFFRALEQAIAIYAQDTGETFLSVKTRDAITYLKLLTTSYDVAVANPPYTDSADFGRELKIFIEDNYKKPHKFHTNLYATFIKRCYELTGSNGKIAMIHPRTFMFIKTFEDVRKFILEKTHINVFIDYSLSNLFGAIMVDPAFYVIEKSIQMEMDAWFVSLDQYTRTPSEKYKKDFCLKALDDYISSVDNEHNYTIPQSKLKIIKSYPFIYWISDGFREKFERNSISAVAQVAEGLTTADNLRFLRFWWELCFKYKDLSTSRKWFPYAKGGKFNKYYGNMWTVINWEENGSEIKNKKGASVRNEKFYFLTGITFSASGTKGASFRLLEEGCIFDSVARSIFLKANSDTFYAIGLLNSKLVYYILNCFNPTVNTTVGDISRIPFIEPSDKLKSAIVLLSKANVELKKEISKFNLFDDKFEYSALSWAFSKSIRSQSFINFIKNYFNYENLLVSQVLANESIIDEKIFEIYELNPNDRAMVLSREGESIGNLPVVAEAKIAYLEETEAIETLPLGQVRNYIDSLPDKIFTGEERETIESEFPTLWQKNNDLEEFCLRHKINPINVWYWFKQSNVIPQQRMHTLAIEFLVDIVREILIEDEDGIIPLVPNAGEKILLDRIEEKFYEKGFSSAQYSGFDGVLGRPIQEYLDKYFFSELSDHLNLFMYLPKTPFIWHLTSGPEQGFDCYIIIYKWTRDKLYRIRSIYLEHRERALVNRKADLQNNDSAAAQNEKERIDKQLRELESFKQKIDELLAEGYDPVLDDGVGKNIAPLQKKGMLAYEVLNAGQLKKYLNADW